MLREKKESRQSALKVRECEKRGECFFDCSLDVFHLRFSIMPLLVPKERSIAQSLSRFLVSSEKREIMRRENIEGLRTLFPLLMRTPARAKRKDTTPDEHEEHVCSVS